MSINSTKYSSTFQVGCTKHRTSESSTRRQISGMSAYAVARGQRASRPPASNRSSSPTTATTTVIIPLMSVMRHTRYSIRTCVRPSCRTEEERGKTAAELEHGEERVGVRSALLWRHIIHESPTSKNAMRCKEL